MIPDFVVSDSGCWLRTKRVDRDGYGRIGKRTLAHRYFWEAFNGPIPDGLELDHLCRVTSCCNPSHLEPVTHRENMLRGEGNIGAVNFKKARCPRGHEYSRIWRNHRICQTCNTLAKRRKR